MKGVLLMTVVSLDDHRSSERRTNHPMDPAECSICGSQWFVLVGRTSDPDVPASGAVTLGIDGMITGYIGDPHCAECGAAWVGR